jgi:hypothetical protein
MRVVHSLLRGCVPTNNSYSNGPAQPRIAGSRGHQFLVHTTAAGQEIFYSQVVNRQWMRDQLTEYLALLEKYFSVQGPPLATTSTGQHTRRVVSGRTATLTELRRREPTVKEVLKRLDPTLSEFKFETVGGKDDARNAAQRGLGILDGMDDWAAHLAPDAPTLPADQFHPWVWDAARTFWNSKHYRDAVRAAATAINAHTQAKVGRRDIADNDLMNQVLKEPTRPGQKYLQIPGDPNDQTVQSRNRALRPFAEGCFAGIRNPAAHEHGPDWAEQKALEHLAALSVLARWIDECEVNETH